MGKEVGIHDAALSDTENQPSMEEVGHQEEESLATRSCPEPAEILMYMEMAKTAIYLCDPSLIFFYIRRPLSLVFMKEGFPMP